MKNKNKFFFNLIIDYFEIFNHLSKLRILQLITLSILSFFLSISEMLSLASIIPLINIFIGAENFSNNQIIDIILLISKKLNFNSPLSSIIFIFMILILVTGSLKILELILSISFSTNVEADIKEKIYNIYLHKPYELQINKNANEIMSILTQKTNLAASSIYSLIGIFSSLLICICIFSFLLTINPILIASIFLIITSFFLIIFFFKNKQIFERGKKMSLIQNQVVESFDSASGYAKEINIYNLQNFFSNKFSFVARSYAQNYQKNFIIGNSPRIYLEYFSLVLLVLIIYYLSLSDNNIESLSLLVAVGLGAQKLLPLINKVYNAFVNIKSNQPIILEILNYINTNQQVFDNNHFQKQDEIIFLNHIKFNKVSFAYDNSKTNQIGNLSFSIDQGNNVAIKGKTGSGKSTLGNLIVGLLKPHKGQILVDNKNITLQNLKSWQKNISVVPQKVFLNDVSIYENIALGVNSENIDKEKIHNIGRIILLNEFVENLPLKYDQKVGKDGIKLSGGQIKRISIARALYRDTPIILFDETTNELDEHTEKLILQNLNKFYKGKTLIFISHRNSILDYCDKIIDLEKINDLNS